MFSFDEKTQVQALDRAQPSLPMKRGRGQTLTHDDKRHGTTDPFEATNLGTGKVLFETKKYLKEFDVLAFFKLIDLHDRRGARHPRRARQRLGPQGTSGGQVVGGSEACTLAS